MWQSQYVTTTDVSAEKLFCAITDINRWIEWDHELESIHQDGSITPGAYFVLKPKGGPNVKMSIEELQHPSLMADIAHLPLGKIRTVHEFLQSEAQTTIKFTIQIYGPLGFFWRKVVGEKQVEGAAAQIASFTRYAAENY